MPSVSIRNLFVMAYGNGLTIWSYKAQDTPKADIPAPGYWWAASDMLAEGDMIIVSAAEGMMILGTGAGGRIDRMCG